MKAMIGCCGIDCETCDAYLATKQNDDALREKTAALWSRLNGAEITPEMINCTGCRMPGTKTPFCEGICPIRKCAAAKAYPTCGSCPETESCETVGAIFTSTPEAKKNLGSDKS